MRTYKKKMTQSKGATSNAEKALYKQGYKAVKPKRKPPGLKPKRPRGAGATSDFEQKLYRRSVKRPPGLGMMSDFEQKLYKRGK